MTIFERIVKGEIPCFKIEETEDFLAFLDIRPVAPGHTLVIPKKLVDPLFEMSDTEIQKIFVFAKQVAKKLEARISCKRICLAVVGFEVPHAHIHLIPTQSMADFPWPGGEPASMESLREIQQRVNA